MCSRQTPHVNKRDAQDVPRALRTSITLGETDEWRGDRLPRPKCTPARTKKQGAEIFGKPGKGVRVSHQKRNQVIPLHRTNISDNAIARSSRGDNLRVSIRESPGNPVHRASLAEGGIKGQSFTAGHVVHRPVPSLGELVRAVWAQVSDGHRPSPNDSMRPAGFEPATPGLGNRCSIQLSYERSRALIVTARFPKPKVRKARRDRGSDDATEEGASGSSETARRWVIGAFPYSHRIPSEQRLITASFIPAPAEQAWGRSQTPTPGAPGPA